MIQTKEELKNYLAAEKGIYVSPSPLQRLQGLLRGDRNALIWKYVKTMRKLEYHFSNRRNPYHMLMNVLCSHRFHRLGLRLGMEIGKGAFQEGLTIYHTHGIVVNGDAKIGKNCILHGANVIGNKGTDLKTPILGNNVRLGAGAMVLVDVTIADDVQIGAGAVVLHSCYEKGALLVGVPAKIHRKNAGDGEIL